MANAICGHISLGFFLYIDAKHIRAHLICIKSLIVIFTINPKGDGRWDVSFGGHTATIGRTEMPRYVSLHRGGFLLAARE